MQRTPIQGRIFNQFEEPFEAYEPLQTVASTPPTNAYVAKWAPRPPRFISNRVWRGAVEMTPRLNATKHLPLTTRVNNVYVIRQSGARRGERYTVPNPAASVRELNGTLIYDNEDTLIGDVPVGVSTSTLPRVRSGRGAR